MNVMTLNKLTYGLYAVATTKEDSTPCGCIVNTVLQVTDQNPMVLLSINKAHYTTGQILRTRRFSVSIFSQETDAKVFPALGFRSGRDITDKFEDLTYRLEEELPILGEHCCGYLLCDVIETHDAETHVVIMARVADAFDGTSEPPMSYAYYHQEVKGKAKAAAQSQAPAGERWVCDVCGFVYEGDLTKEPETYVCPICKKGKQHFSKG